MSLFEQLGIKFGADLSPHGASWRQFRQRRRSLLSALVVVHAAIVVVFVELGSVCLSSHNWNEGFRVWSLASGELGCSRCFTAWA